MYIGAVAEKFAGQTELVAWADTNPGRLDYYDEFLADRSTPLPLRYDPSRIAAMISEQAVDIVDGDLAGLHPRGRHRGLPAGAAPM